MTKLLSDCQNILLCFISESCKKCWRKISTFGKRRSGAESQKLGISQSSSVAELDYFRGWYTVATEGDIKLFSSLQAARDFAPEARLTLAAMETSLPRGTRSQYRKKSKMEGSGNR